MTPSNFPSEYQLVHSDLQAGIPWSWGISARLFQQNGFTCYFSISQNIQQYKKCQEWKQLNCAKRTWKKIKSSKFKKRSLCCWVVESEDTDKSAENDESVVRWVRCGWWQITFNWPNGQNTVSLSRVSCQAGPGCVGGWFSLHREYVFLIAFVSSESGPL